MSLQEFAKRFTKLDPAVGYVAFAFLVACIYPVFSLRDDGLDKSFAYGAAGARVAVIIAMTLYNRIAGIIALIVIIAMLNQTPNKKGMINSIPTLDSSTTTSSSSISFKTPAEFRKKYCIMDKGVPDDLSGNNNSLNLTYMLSPAFFTKVDASGNLQLTDDEIAAIQSMDTSSFNQCKPTTIKGTPTYQTINNMCDPVCNWTIKPAHSASTTEGFMPMLRPHIRTARHVVSNGMDNLKSTANRLKRRFF